MRKTLKLEDVVKAVRHAPYSLDIREGIAWEIAMRTLPESDWSDFAQMVRRDVEDGIDLPDGSTWQR